MVLSILLSFNCVRSYSRQFRSCYWKTSLHFCVVLEITELYFISYRGGLEYILNVITYSKNLAVITSNNSYKQRQPFFFHNNES